MGHALSIELPPGVYELLRRMAEETHQSPEELAAEWLIATIERIADDPLLKLAGTVPSDVSDAAGRHDEYIGRALMRELRGSVDE